MTDHYHGIYDTRKSIDILKVVKAILKAALSYRPEKEGELLELGEQVKLEIYNQKQLLKKLKHINSLGHAYEEKLEEINLAYEETKRIQREIAHIPFEQKTIRISGILRLLQNNRGRIEILLKEGGPQTGPIPT